MAEHLGRRPSRGSQDSLFRGKGKAVLTILGYKNWKSFLKVEDRDLTVEEMVDIEYSADYDNFAVEGQIRVNWPDITVEFNMDRFTGLNEKDKRRKPLIVSATENFAKLMHPFVAGKPWFKGLNNQDVKKFNGFEWVFEQDKEDCSYLGHIRKGREIFVTFAFSPL